MKLNVKPSSCPVPSSASVSLSPLTVDRSVCNLQAEMERHLKDERKGERLRSGVQVVIAGATNAGKSSLLNKLCKGTEETHTHTTYYLVNTDLTVESNHDNRSLEGEEGSKSVTPLAAFSLFKKNIV